MRMKLITAYITEQHHRMLEARARDLGVGKAKVLRAALDEAVDAYAKLYMDMAVAECQADSDPLAIQLSLLEVEP